MDTTAWEINESEFKKDTTQQEKLKFLLRYAILAPSGHNTQPWKFAFDEEGIKVFTDFSRGLPVADPDYRELYISIGCAIGNLIAAGRHFGYIPDVKYFPNGLDSECAAVIGFSKSMAAGENDQFNSIAKRHTNRSVFEDKPIKTEIADLAANGDIRQYNNPEYRKELGYWVGRGAFGHKGITAKIGKFFISYS